MLSRLALAPLAAGAAALAISGCGLAQKPATSSSGQKFTGQKANVAQAVDDFASAAGKGDGKKLCTQIFTHELAQRLGSGKLSCQDALTDQLNDVDTSTVAIDSITVNGNTATAKVTSTVYGHDGTQTLRLRLEDQSWRVAGIGS